MRKASTAWTTHGESWRYDFNTIRSYSSLANQTLQQARRALEKFEGFAPGALGQDDQDEYRNPNCRLSL
jgi:putative transposase